MDNKALEIVKNYIFYYVNKEPCNLFIVWKCKALQNYKYLITSTLNDGMYYELTYNGDKNEWYLDIYKKHGKYTLKE